MRRVMASSLACLIMAACSSGNSELSASAAAVANADGSTSIRQATSAELSELNETVTTAAKVDQRFPPSEPPTNVQAIKANGVVAPGLLQLEDGCRVRMDGVTCSPEGIEYISRLALDATTAIAYIPSSSEIQDPVPAEVWLVDSSLHDTDSSLGLSYSSIAETAIKSGWCIPIRTPTNPHNDRYQALYEAFGKHPKLGSNNSFKPNMLRGGNLLRYFSFLLPPQSMSA